MAVCSAWSNESWLARGEKKAFLRKSFRTAKIVFQLEMLLASVAKLVWQVTSAVLLRITRERGAHLSALSAQPLRAVTFSSQRVFLSWSSLSGLVGMGTSPRYTFSLN